MGKISCKRLRPEQSIKTANIKNTLYQLNKKSDCLLHLKVIPSKLIVSPLTYRAYFYENLGAKKREIEIYPLSFKLPLCWLHSLTPVTLFSMLPGINSLVVAIHLEIHWVYILVFLPENILCQDNRWQHQSPSRYIQVINPMGV